MPGCQTRTPCLRTASPCCLVAGLAQLLRSRPRPTRRATTVVLMGCARQYHPALAWPTAVGLSCYALPARTPASSSLPAARATALLLPACGGAPSHLRLRPDGRGSGPPRGQHVPPRGSAMGERCDPGDTCGPLRQVLALRTSTRTVVRAMSFGMGPTPCARRYARCAHARPPPSGLRGILWMPWPPPFGLRGSLRLPWPLRDPSRLRRHPSSVVVGLPLRSLALTWVGAASLNRRGLWPVVRYPSGKQCLCEASC